MEANSLLGDCGGLALEQTKGRFRKELIHTGEYTIPSDPERKIVITTERLQNWVKAFQESGIKVWVPLGHSRAPEQNVGWVTELYLADDTLMAVLEITDPVIAEKLRSGSIADVSIGVEYEFVNCDGISWPEIVRHVALTVDPHIRHQGEFEELQDESGPLEVAAEAETEVEELSCTNAEFSGLTLSAIKPDDRETVELEQICLCRTEMRRLEIEREVQDWLIAGKITPAVKSRLVELMVTGEKQMLCFEQNQLSFSALLRSIITDLPGIRLKAECNSRLGMVHPNRREVTTEERELLSKLGISEDVYLKYKP